MLKQIFPMLKSTIGILFPFLCFVFGYGITHSFFHTKEICTPNIVGKSIHDTVKKLSPLGLNIRLLREQEDADLPTGIILEQIPQQNTTIKPNQHVFVTLSKRPAQILAPEMWGIDHKQITDRCKKLGVQAKTFWLESYRPKDRCLAQSPHPGKALDKRSIITYLSSGKNMLCVFPHLKQQNLDAVKNFLESEGICVEVFETKTKKQPDKPLKIIDQKPMAGSIIDMSKKISVQLQVG